MSDVTMIGLGPMGSALARALLAAGRRVTVWNRTPARAQALAGQGARPVLTIEEALAASPLTIICLANYGAMQSALAGKGEYLAGRALIGLNSGTPAEARAMQEWAGRHHIDFLSGAIMVPPTLVGTPQALFFYSGAQAVFETHRGLVKTLGGDARFLDQDPGLALLYNTALLGLYWSTMTGYLHATALVGTAGVEARSFTPLAREFLAVPADIMTFLASQIDDRHYPGTTGQLTMDATAMDHLIETSQAEGISLAVPQFLRGIVQKTIEAGHGMENFASVIETLRAGDIGANRPAACGQGHGR